MKKRNKFKNKDQFQLCFQAVSDCFQPKEKELNSQSNRAFKLKAIQKTQSKGLSKKSYESNLKESACGSKQPQALFFENLISVKTVAERLGLAPKTIHNWVYLRKIPYVKCGHKVMFRPKSLKAWLNRKEIKSWQ